MLFLRGSGWQVCTGCSLFVSVPLCVKAAIVTTCSVTACACALHRHASSRGSGLSSCCHRGILRSSFPVLPSTFSGESRAPTAAALAASMAVTAPAARAMVSASNWAPHHSLLSCQCERLQPAHLALWLQWTRRPTAAFCLRSSGGGHLHDGVADLPAPGGAGRIDCALPLLQRLLPLRAAGLDALSTRAETARRV